MDIKKIKNINFNLEIKITEEQKKKAVGMLFRNARLFFLIFVGAMTVYSFDLVFKKAYVDINYIQYPLYTSTLGGGSSRLDQVLEILESRKGRTEEIKGKGYADPFSYRDEKIQEPEDEDNAQPAGAEGAGVAGAGENNP